jgi:hypothetical protein
MILFRFINTTNEQALSGHYVITISGPIKIIRADVPDFVDLPKEKQIEMLKQIEALNKEKYGN